MYVLNTVDIDRPGSLESATNFKVDFTVGKVSADFIPYSESDCKNFLRRHILGNLPG